MFMWYKGRMSMENEIKIKKRVSAWRGANIGVLLLMIFFIIIMLPLLFFNISIAIQASMNPNKVPSVFGVTPLVVQTDIFESSGIDSGDLIFVDATSPERIEESKVIAYSYNGGIYLGEVVEIVQNGNYFSFQTGEGEEINSYYITSSNVIGVYNGARLVGVGAFLLFLQTTPGIILSVSIPMIVLIAYVLVRNRYFVVFRKSLAEKAEVRAQTDFEKKTDEKLKSIELLERERRLTAKDTGTVLYDENKERSFIKRDK